MDKLTKFIELATWLIYIAFVFAFCIGVPFAIRFFTCLTWVVKRQYRKFFNPSPDIMVMPIPIKYCRVFHDGNFKQFNNPHQFRQNVSEVPAEYFEPETVINDLKRLGFTNIEIIEFHP